MQISKRLQNLITLVIFCSGTGLYSQSKLDMPQMPDMPSMPEISSEVSMPKISDSYGPEGFYVPTFPGQQTQKTDKFSSQKASSTAATTTATLSDGTSGEDLISSFINANTVLTASDISTLYDSGKFSSLSGLSGNNTTTNAMLQQILTSLDELKAEQKKTSAAEKQTLEQHQLDNETFKKREPKILRFKINNYSMTDSLVTVFFSDPEPDGSFLLTADRRYFANQKARTETFYILFKAVRNSGSSTTYTVQPSVVQDSKNENSYIYKFCHLKNLTAEKTGNLVVLKNDSDVTVDLLIDIDK